MPKLSISLAQLNIAFGDVRRNISQVEKAVAEAARRGSHIVVLPELWPTGYDWDNHRQLAEPINGNLVNQLTALAQDHKISILGSFLERRGEMIANSAPFIAANGRVMGIYRKIHLFTLFDEDRYLQAGSASLTMDLPWGRTGVAICYDLRFPELFRLYGVEETKLILIPSEWPLARVDHWRTLLQARAIENQCYVAACNAAGTTGDTVYGGHSMIVDPWGKIVAEAGEEPLMLTAEVEMDLVDETRRKIPVFKDRVPDAYQFDVLSGQSLY